MKNKQKVNMTKKKVDEKVIMKNIRMEKEKRKMVNKKK